MEKIQVYDGENMSHNLCNCVEKDKEILRLKEVLRAKETEIMSLRKQLDLKTESIFNCTYSSNTLKSTGISNGEILRYSRQIILPTICVRGQLKLKNASIFIAGAGGLGCPVGLYLAAAGVGTIGIADYDDVEITNIHRQVLHKEKNIGMSKCESFIRAIKDINSSTNCISHKVQLNSKNISEIVPKYDILVDASDNLPTRYLLNDAAVLFNKPLVSGSALRFEGQLSVYNVEGSPCFRCLYPAPPSPDTVSNCSESGVIGPVTGIIGCLQALEVLKIAVGLQPSFKNKLLHFDGESGNFRVFKLRGKNSNCDICSEKPKITTLIDYELFCQGPAHDNERNISVLSESERISNKEYKKICDTDSFHILIDVRPEHEYEICNFPNSINIPMNKLKDSIAVQDLVETIKNNNCETAYVICRRGNDSQKAVQLLQVLLGEVKLFDIIGGLQAWHYEIDSNFPIY